MHIQSYILLDALILEIHSTFPHVISNTHGAHCRGLCTQIKLCTFVGALLKAHSVRKHVCLD